MLDQWVSLCFDIVNTQIEIDHYKRSDSDKAKSKLKLLTNQLALLKEELNKSLNIES